MATESIRPPKFMRRSPVCINTMTNLSQHAVEQPVIINIVPTQTISTNQPIVLPTPMPSATQTIRNILTPVHTPPPILKSRVVDTKSRFNILNKSLAENVSHDMPQPKLPISDTTGVLENVPSSSGTPSRKSKKVELPEFLEHSKIQGDGHQILSKSDHIFVRGGGHMVGKHCSHVYVDGFNNHVKNNINHATVWGSHGLVVNSGSIVEAIPFEIEGLKKIGKAQRERIHLIASVNDRGIAILSNPFEKDRPMATTIRLPLSNATALFTLHFVIRSKNGVATGTAFNTVTVTEKGGTVWATSLFDIKTQHNSLPFLFTIEGVDMNRYSNSTAITISNSIGNGELQVVVEGEILVLSD